MYKRIFILFILFFSFERLLAHTINYSLQDAPVTKVSWYYLKLGFSHILPYGFDHLLFMTGLCLMNPSFRSIIYQASAFTLAHTITLALSMKNIIIGPPAIVEPIIALSILFVAIENILLNKVNKWRLLLVFGFGLIHGMGFASALNEIGLPPGKFYLSVIMFNAGIEICQVMVVCILFFCILRPFRDRIWFRRQLIIPASVMIAIISSYWVFERIMAIS